FVGVPATVAVGNAAWWVHNLVVLVFLNLLPRSKHFHILTSVFNVYFRKLEPTGQLSKQDLENATRYGSSHIDHFNWKQVLDKIVDMRRHLVQEESRFPAELSRVFKNMETQSNPWGIDADKRFDWAEGLGVPTLETNPDAEYLYYVGCAGAFDDRNKKTTQA